jgi:nitroreductase
MTDTLDNPTIAMRRAAVRAMLAPSVHNTQPWQFVLRPNELDVFADYSRQLTVLDPLKRQLTISCGCAVFNARAALAGAGFNCSVERFPDRAQPSFVARIRMGERTGANTPLAALDAVLELRQTNRRQFYDEQVPAEVIDQLVSAAEIEDSELNPVTRPEHRMAVASLSQHADQEENANPAYRAELRAWTSDDPSRRDGVPALAIPHVDGTSHDEVPIRDFDTHGAGWLPAETRSSHNQTMLILAAQSDNPQAWLRAGEALERVLLEITRLGYVASPLTQVVEITHTREALREQLGMLTYPDVLLRAGRAGTTPSSRRRRLSDVLREEIA